MSGESEDVDIRGIAAGGDGVGTLADGRTVFVPRTAPGDRVRLRAVRRHARFARADIGELLVEGAGRVNPPCPHYLVDRCGGCQLMHLSAESQREVKGRIVGDALRRIAKLDVPDPVVVASPTALGYRAKVTFAVAGGTIGYHRVGESERLFPVRDCLLAEPALRTLFGAVRSARTFLPPNTTRLVLRQDGDGSLHLVVRTADGNAWRGGQPLHTRLVAKGTPLTVWWHPEGGAPRAVAGSSDPWPATVFQQVHPAMGKMVRHAALSALGELAGTHVWDLYAGIGETTAALVAREATVDSIELDARAVQYAERIGPKGPHRLTGRVEDRIRELAPAGSVITNPPRIGMAPEVTTALATASAQRIAYISCDAATMARDIARMGDAWQLAAISAFDQFPQTAHVECLAVLERR